MGLNRLLALSGPEIPTSVAEQEKKNFKIYISFPGQKIQFSVFKASVKHLAVTQLRSYNMWQDTEWAAMYSPPRLHKYA